MDPFGYLWCEVCIQFYIFSNGYPDTLYHLLNIIIALI